MLATDKGLSSACLFKSATSYNHGLDTLTGNDNKKENIMFVVTINFH